MFILTSSLSAFLLDLKNEGSFRKTQLTTDQLIDVLFSYSLGMVRKASQCYNPLLKYFEEKRKIKFNEEKLKGEGTLTGETSDQKEKVFKS